MTTYVPWKKPSPPSLEQRLMFQLRALHKDSPGSPLLLPGLWVRRHVRASYVITLLLPDSTSPSAIRPQVSYLFVISL